MMNIGNRPTMDNGEAVSVEVYLLNYEGNLYGERLYVEFVSRLRDERRFLSQKALIGQLKQDASDVRSLLG